MPVFGDDFAQEAQRSVGELFLGWIETVVGDLGVQDCPEALDWVQVWAIGGQLDQMDAAIRAREPLLEGVASVIGCVVPNHVNGRFGRVIRIRRFCPINFGLARSGCGISGAFGIKLLVGESRMRSL